MAAFGARLEPKYTEPIYAAIFVCVDTESNEVVDAGGAGSCIESAEEGVGGFAVDPRALDGEVVAY